MAETQIGGIKVKIGSDTTGLESGLKKTRDGLNQVTKWSAAAAAAMTVAGAAMVRSQMDVLDSLGKTSDALGIQQEKLQALHHIGELTGTSSEQLNKSLERMQKNLGNAARNGGASAQALEDMGVSIDTIIDQKPDEQIQLLAVALSNVENQTEKASIANDIFGRNGLRMLKMLDALKNDGLDPTSESIEKMGIALSRVDTTKVENANDALFKSSEVVTGLVNSVAVKLSPVMEAIANQFIDAAVKANGFENALTDAFNMAVRGVGVFLDGFHGIHVALGGVAVGINTMAVSVGEAFTGMAEAVNKFVYDDINTLLIAYNNVSSLFDKEPIKLLEGDADITSFFKAELDKADYALRESKAKFDELINQPLPSESLTNWVSDVEKAATDAAEHIVNAMNNSGASGEGTGPSQEAIEKANAEIESLMLLNETKLEEISRFELERKTLIDDLLAQELITKSEHEAALTEIERSASNGRIDLAIAESQAKHRANQTFFNDLSSLMNSGSRKAFEIGKAAAIANAGVNGVSAAVAAWDAGMATGGPWAPLVAAAYTTASLAKTGAMISTLSSASFGSPASQNESSSSSLPTVSTPQSQQGQTNVSIDIVGSDGATFSRGQVEGLIGQINDAVGDGVVLNTGG